MAFAGSPFCPAEDDQKTVLSRYLHLNECVCFQGAPGIVVMCDGEPGDPRQGEALLRDKPINVKKAPGGKEQTTNSMVITRLTSQT